MKLAAEGCEAMEAKYKAHAGSPPETDTDFSQRKIGEILVSRQPFCKLLKYANKGKMYSCKKFVAACFSMAQKRSNLVLSTI